MITLKCDCCGHEQQFESFEQAFRSGWDAPPYFTGFVCCNLCPAVCVVLGLTHSKAHKLWDEQGRPEEWSIEKCGVDRDWMDGKA